MQFDVAIIGAGMAGASLAWRLAGHARVVLVEAESQPGVHATGRSAAMFMESYGPPGARALTRASRAFYQHPPAGFTDVPLLAPRGALYVAGPGQQALLDESEASLRATGTAIERLDAAAACARVPCLRPEGVIGALFEPDAQDIDVHALHHAFLRGARQRGVDLWTSARLSGARYRHDSADARWLLDFADARQLQARTLVNAAGAWADEVARLAGVAPLGLVPRRRSAFTFDAPAGIDVRHWPVVGTLDDAEGWYFKPDAGRLLGSPANADVTVPHDVQAEELDIAVAIHRIQQATTLAIRRPASTWAGLRTFASDGELVIGPDAAQPAFFWLAGQGGYGIQSAAGASALAAALWAGQAMPADLVAAGVDVQASAPQRHL
jgi:D-arginine dehydrogenase